MPAEIDTFTITTKRNLLLFMISFALGAGLAFNVRPLIFLGESLIVLAVFAWMRSGRRTDLFSFRRCHHPRCFEGDLLLVGIESHYRGRVPLHLVELRDTFPPGDTYYVTSLVPHFKPRHEIQLTYEAICSRKRGLYTLGPLRVRCADPLGIFAHEYEFPTLSTLYVYPQVPDIEGFDLLEEGTLRHVGQEVVSRVGHSEEFRSIREYRPGDALSIVHWPSTARHGRPMVKEFDENIVTDVTLFLDLHRLSLRGLGDVTSIEYMIKAAVAIVRAAIARSHRVRIFAISHRTDHVPLGGGWPHLLTILDRMTLYRAGGEHDFVAEVQKRLAFLARGGTVVFVVSATNFDADRLAPTLEQLVSEPMKVIVVLIDDRSFLKLYLEQETRLEAPRMAQTVAKLKQIGCRVITARSGEDLRVRMESVE